MADFIPSEKTAEDFNNGVEYEDGIDEQTGDVVHAETINNLVESALWSQGKAKNAVGTANDAVTIASTALNRIGEAIAGTVVSDGNYPNMSVGNANNATNDKDGNNISQTYVKISDIDRLILETEYPIGGKPYIQFKGMQTPAERWANTAWEIDTNYQGKTIIGSGGDYIFGATGGSTTHRHFAGTPDEDNTALHALLQYNYQDGQTVINESEGTVDFGAGWEPRRQLIIQGDRAYSGQRRSAAIKVVGAVRDGTTMQPYLVVNYWKRIS